MASFHGTTKFPEFREKTMDCKRVEEKDYFREIPLRYLGYANEVGEAFRNMIPLRGVYLSYAISTAYVVSHAASQGLKVQQNNQRQPHHYHTHHDSQKHTTHHSTNTTTTVKCSHSNNTIASPLTAVIDTLIWQGLASVIIPGLTINRLCAVSRFALNRHTGRLLSVQMRKWAVTGIGLGSIPLIIHPIDSAVDSFMNFCVRPMLLRT